MTAVTTKSKQKVIYAYKGESLGNAVTAVTSSPHGRGRSAFADEFERVLRLAAGTRQFPLLVLAEATGLRRGEDSLRAALGRHRHVHRMLVDRSVEETKAGGVASPEVLALETAEVENSHEGSNNS